ncbi:zinc ribbon domain-containing protein [Halomicroarcula sp. F13]|uniref:Zinc ribbon domain-containing protein n=1 Tax=Haloarcula rubra TaxID=2487747 RepID=A0AAW4PSH1_9EURY|nr:zinc ribbon domain-containing protein [Halomicroarcula rubra]MBX0323656.1 zinc ribbon domain-containing protein [Halomicroarcula rubra]
MADRSEAGEPTCPACGAPLETLTDECSSCGERLFTDEQLTRLDEQMAAAFAHERDGAPGWAVALTGLALGVAIAPLVVYTAVIAVGGLSLAVLVGLALAGWLLPAAYLGRFPTPSAALARGLYLVVAGVGAVLVALAYDASTGGTSLVTQRTGLVATLLAIPAIVAVLLARRVAARAARQARGEPGPFHERAGIEPADDGDESDDAP